MSVARVWPSRTTRRPASSRCTGSGSAERAPEGQPLETVLDGGDPGSRGHVGNLPVPTGDADTCCSPIGATLLAWLSKACPASSAPDVSGSASPSTSSRRTSPTTTALAAVEKYDDRFLDREISWLHFNQRVLELAEDPDLPLLERVRFLAIFASNLDEFFMVRVAGLKRRIAAGVAVRAASGLLPREVLERIWAGTRELMERHARLFRDEIVPALRTQGIELVRWADLDREEQKACKRLFRDRVFPVLTPLAVDPAHPFPYISGLSLNLAVARAQPEDRQGALRAGEGAADLQPVRAARATSGSCRSRTSSASTSSGCSRAWRCSRRTRSG